MERHKKIRGSKRSGIRKTMGDREDILTAEGDVRTCKEQSNKNEKGSDTHPFLHYCISGQLSDVINYAS
jgi:hypothetical protein